MRDLESLDDDVQRRVILQAAKAGGRDVLNDYRSEQPTLAELRSETSQTFWLCFASGFILFFPWLALPFLTLPKWRVLSRAQRDWLTLSTMSDPECEHLVLVGSVRRLLGTLPRSMRRQSKEIARELDAISRQWQGLRERRERLEAVIAAGGAADLERRRADLTARIELEPDAVVRGSLESQLRALDGQQSATRDLTVWRERLAAAQEECTQNLLHLRARLSVLAASGGLREAAVVAEASATLQQINTRLTAAQDAVEEVLHVSA